MPITLLGLVLTVALVLPGFLIADLAESRRATIAARSDVELVLRGLAYALILQGLVALTGWTAKMIEDLNAVDGWWHHLDAIALFVLAVGIVAPTALGLGLSAWLRNAEQNGELRPWHYALGGRDHREAWDFVFSRKDGAYLVLTVSEGSRTRHLLAKFGAQSWASQAPTRPQEVYFEEVWPADADGRVTEQDVQRQPGRGIWVSADSIDRFEVLHPVEDG